MTRSPLLASLSSLFHVQAFGFIFVIDATNPDRFAEVKTALCAVLEHQFVRDKPMVILLNKQDRTDAAIPTSRVLEAIAHPEFGESPCLEIGRCVHQCVPCTRLGVD